jgi:hypothetical protein
MEYFFIWVASATLAAFIAGRKGRGVYSWFVLGILFSFLAIAVLVLLPSIDEEADDMAHARKYGESDRYKKCPSCAEAVRKEAIKCKHCQSSLGGGA